MWYSEALLTYITSNRTNVSLNSMSQIIVRSDSLSSLIRERETNFPRVGDIFEVMLN